MPSDFGAKWPTWARRVVLIDHSPRCATASRASACPTRPRVRAARFRPIRRRTEQNAPREHLVDGGTRSGRSDRRQAGLGRGRAARTVVARGLEARDVVAPSTTGAHLAVAVAARVRRVPAVRGAHPRDAGDPARDPGRRRPCRAGPGERLAHHGDVLLRLRRPHPGLAGLPRRGGGQRLPAGPRPRRVLLGARARRDLDRGRRADGCLAAVPLRRRPAARADPDARPARLRADAPAERVRDLGEHRGVGAGGRRRRLGAHAGPARAALRAGPALVPAASSTRTRPP